MLELLGFGTDVSKVRNQLLENLEVVKDPNFVEAILKKFEDRLKERADLLEQLIEDEAVFPIQMIIGALFTALFGFVGYNLLKKIAQQPLLINRVHCLAVEVLYNLENDDNGEEIGFLIKLMQRKHQFFLSEAVQLLKEKGEKAGVEHYFQFLKEEPQEDPNYDRFFAYTLRQTTAFQIQNFLKEKQAIYQGDFLEFLDIILIDFRSIFSAKSLKVAKRWLEEERKAIKVLENGQKTAIPLRK